uniref:Odorant receptor n=1 Tax=Hedya nubiferana TaxID=572853 RepID=A0A223HD26_9NEOP|nr:putative odorant receptor OR55 [Hedya nubiferana]
MPSSLIALSNFISYAHLIMDSLTYHTSAAINHFKKITKIIYILTATNFWYEDIELPSVFVKINNISKLLEILIITLVVTGIGARYTQDGNLTEKQNTDVLMKSLSSFFVYAVYGCTVYHEEGIKELLLTLTVTLKGMFNDEKVERMMIKKTYQYLMGLIFVGCCPMVAYGVEGAVNALTSNATFTTIIPIWPDLEDRSHFAGFARILIYIVWLLLVAHVVCIYSVIISVSICLGHQYANLCEYFLSLHDIFDGEGRIEEMETRYENAVRDGIKMHCITLRCVNQLQRTCSVAYSGQVIINVCVMLLLMIQMMQTERSLVQLAPIVFMGTGVLVSSGLIIWSAGDITFEAQRLPTAMFHSGWYNCCGNSVRVRKMITIAMVQAQQPVVIKGLGIIELSYNSYVAIVKSSYSVFSVIY